MTPLSRGIISSGKLGVVPPAFSPNDISGIKLWADASLGGYTDLSTLSGTFTNTNGTIETNALNGLSVFDFDGTAFITIDSLDLGDFSIFFVIKPDSAVVPEGTQQKLMGDSAGLVDGVGNINFGGLTGGITNEVVTLFNNASALNTAAYTTSTLTNSYQVLEMTLATATAGIKYGEVAQSVSLFNGGINNTDKKIGVMDQIGKAHAASLLNAKIAAVYIYDNNISGGDKTDLYTYINNRFAL